LDLTPVCIVLLAEALLQAAEKLVIAPLKDDTGIGQLLLKSLLSRLKLLAHGFDDPLREFLRPIFNRLQFWYEPLPEFLLSLGDFLLDGYFCRPKDLFRSFAGLAVNLFSEVVTQTCP